MMVCGYIMTGVVVVMAAVVVENGGGCMTLECSLLMPVTLSEVT